MHDVNGVAPRCLMQLGDGSPRAADRVEGPPLQGFELRLGLAHMLAHELAGLLQRAAREILQGQAAERHRHALADDRTAHVHEFEGAAAHVPYDAIRGVEARDAERGQFGFSSAGEKLDLAAAGSLGGTQEIRAVLGVARGGRRQDEDLRYPHRLAQDAEAVQGRERASDGLVVQAARGEHVSPEAAQHLLVVHRRRRAAEPVIGDEPHRVRADIDDGDRSAPVAGEPLRDLGGGEDGAGACQAVLS